MCIIVLHCHKLEGTDPKIVKFSMFGILFFSGIPLQDQVSKLKIPYHVFSVKSSFNSILMQLCIDI